MNPSDPGIHPETRHHSETRHHPDTDTEPIPEGARHMVPGQPSPSEQEALDGLLAVLDLKPETGVENADEDVFVGQSQRQPFGRVYGGQVLSQALIAAQQTVDPARPVHSLHGYFLRAGDSNEPITFAVERLRDGRSFSARRTHALQFGRPILSMISSFQHPAEGLDHQVTMPDVPAPEDLPTMADRYGHLDDPVTRFWLRQRPFDLRHVDPPLFIQPAPERSTSQAVWMRAVGALPDDAPLHAAALAYASDFLMLEPILRAHGRTFSQLGLRMASLDHAMWWHRPARADAWLLFVLESPSASGARGLGTGRIFDRQGRLVCSVAQEGMLRVPPE